MIVEELKQIVLKNSQKGLSKLYVRSLLKEYLQVYVLNFIYTNSFFGKSFIFTGGTCLRHCFGLNRLSEDLDFDLEKKIDAEKLKDGLGEYFSKKIFYKDVKISVGQKGRQVLLKFPVLKQLGLATLSESDLLYVKIDLSEIRSKKYEKITMLKSLYNFNYIVTSYDLPSLMANKINAVLTRVRFMGKESTEAIKGRDYFDLLWFLEKEVRPNLERINDLLGKKYSMEEVLSLVDKKVILATTKYKTFFRNDLLPFIDNPELIDPYIEGYAKNYEMRKGYLLKNLA